MEGSQVTILCSICGRTPHLIDDPECMPATKPIAEKLAWALAEIERLRAGVRNPRDEGYRQEIYGPKPDDLFDDERLGVLYYMTSQDPDYCGTDLDFGRLVMRETIDARDAHWLTIIGRLSKAVGEGEGVGIEHYVNDPDLLEILAKAEAS